MDSKGTNGGARILEHEGVTEDCISERRLWTAVVVMAVEDWRNGSLRARPEAQSFCLKTTRIFRRCARARVSTQPRCGRGFSRSGNAFTCTGRTFNRWRHKFSSGLD
jgi:hypothetical protein